MKVVIRVLLALCVLWSIGWLGVSTWVRSSITTWFEARAAEGWQADYAGLSSAGYPNRVVTVLTNPALADPETGTAWRSDGLTFQSNGLWPGTVDVIFADTPQQLSYLDQTVTVTADDLVARLDLKPGSALDLRHAGITSGPWAVTEEGAVIATAASMGATLTQDDDPLVYAFAFSADAFGPGDSIRRLLSGSNTLPDAFETLALQMDVTFDRPWDRRALEERRPQPRRIDLYLAEAVWGPMRLLAAAELDIDATGSPTGEVTIRAENWNDMLDLIRASGALADGIAETAGRALDVFAGLSGNPDALDLTIGFRDGQMTLGFLPLGPAPRFFLR